MPKQHWKRQTTVLDWCLPTLWSTRSGSFFFFFFFFLFLFFLLFYFFFLNTTRHILFKWWWWWWWWFIPRRWGFWGRMMVSSCTLIGGCRDRFLMPTSYRTLDRRRFGMRMVGMLLALSASCVFLLRFMPPCLELTTGFPHWWAPAGSVCGLLLPWLMADSRLCKLEGLSTVAQRAKTAVATTKMRRQLSVYLYTYPTGHLNHFVSVITHLFTST